jgi:hypothetical protein
MIWELFSVLALLTLNIIIILILIFVLKFMHKKAKEMQSKLKETGIPDRSKTYNRNFKKLAEQTANVLEKLKVENQRISVDKGSFYFAADFKPNPVDRFRVYIEILENNEYTSTVNLDIRTQTGSKINIWMGKLTRFMDNFFELLDSETLDGKKFEEAYEQFLSEIKKDDPKKDLYDLQGKWNPVGFQQYVIMVGMFIFAMGSAFAFGLTYLGLVLDESALGFEAMAIVLSTIFTFIALWDYWDYKDGKMRLIGIRIPRKRIKFLENIESVLISTKINYTIKKKTGMQFNVVYHIKEHNFRIRVFLFQTEILAVLIVPVKDENESIASMLMIRLDERFIEENYAFFTYKIKNRLRKSKIENRG